MANPKRRRRSRNRSHARRSRRRSNPLFGRTRVRRYRHSRRRSNPGVAGFNTTELIKLAGGAAVGVVGSKYLSQLALGSNNSGAMGAAAQGVATLALAWLGNKFGGKDVATGIVAGGFGAIALSLASTYIGAPGGSMSGLGDPLGAMMLGDFVPGTIPMPGAFNAPMVVASKKSNGR
jgi:hypothetical protein